ncbi:unnamed protein product [Adineta steineri]|uniref:Transposase n=1 Tax=Adineta steineri TaxID=433720 RepID=A0A815RY81_9BILA|nr:unnamed protein product [Adineta steineri]CAF4011233.1 unnamed protein product [Adineta steineri]
MSSSIINSQSLPTSSSDTQEYSTDKITFRLKNDKSNFKVIENDVRTFKSKCWKFFEFLARKNEVDEYQRIPGFVSCRQCFKTYTYTSTTGTRQLNSHSCVVLAPAESQSSITTNTTKQMTLGNVSKNLKQVKVDEKEISNFKTLVSKWICEDLRSFSVVEDNGLGNVFQEFISLGAKYGNFDVMNIVRGANTISRYTHSLADDYRFKLKQMLKEPFENEAICISPDMWSDRHKQLSYLGVSCSCVDADFNYKVVDLCCRPYYEIDHSSDNILSAIQKVLEDFDLNDLSRLNFMIDRGPNLMKALKPYRPLNCYGHRMNNVLKRSFFQINKKKRKNETAGVQAAMAQSNKKHNDSDLSTSSSEDDIETILPIVKRKKKANNVKAVAVKSNSVDPRKLELKDLEPAAQTVIETIVNCKKLAGLNKDIQSAGGIALQQSTIVRWLSMIQLLESILASYKQTKCVLATRKQRAKLAVIDKKVVEGLIRLLKPFKKTLKLVQTGNSPSLYMVLICTLNLRKTLSSFKNLISSTSLVDNNETDKVNSTDDDENEDIIESEGLRIIRERIVELLDLMFQLDVRHVVATMLHPKYRQLRGCSQDERNQACQYIREEMNKIIQSDRFNDPRTTEPIKKKQKIEKSILEEYEDTTENESDLSEKQDDIDSGIFDYKPVKADELSKYLEMYIDKTKLSQNPLEFWKEHRNTYPILARVARKIHCIPATSAAVERQFSGTGVVLNERRTSLDPEHLDNILFIRAMERMK